MDRTIWAVGGGKGGTGKSFVASSLGISLAARGCDAVLVDVDLGAPNLHTFLGVKDAHPNLGDFLAGQIPALGEAVQPTACDGLGLIRGPENTFFIANMNHYKKLKLMRHIKTLNASRVILDLGPGSAFNSLDFFISADKPILVLTPEPTSIENGYYFLKSCILRVLKLYMEHYRIQDLLQRLLEQIEKNSHSLYSFFQTLIDEDRNYAHVLYRALKTFKPLIVMNMARNERDRLLGASIAEVARKHLLVDLTFLGAVPYDARVHASLVERRPFAAAYPGSETAAALREILYKLENPAAAAEDALAGG
jgi:flagellar biosynthesis protein FlhG